MPDPDDKITLTKSVPRRAETSVNEDLAALLNSKLSWSVTAQLIGKQDSGVPDIVVAEQGRATVLVENEISPARTVLKDAISRLGVRINHETITNVVELKTSSRYREILTSEDAREHMLVDSEFQYALLTGETFDDYSRFPSRGYLKGSLDDLALFIREASVPSEVLAEAIQILDQAVSKGVHCLREVVQRSTDTMQELAVLLCQDFDEESTGDESHRTVDQALGIVATVILNAMTFQQQLAGDHDIESIARMRQSEQLNQSGFLKEWQKILDVNYWSIFALAVWLLEAIRTPMLADRLVEELASSAETLARLRLQESHDLAGTVFQRFIADRKYLASFFTRTESAAMLAHLALPPRICPDEYSTIKMADFACGTGTLIHAAYSRAAVLNQIAGGDSRRQHKQMIERNIVALDIVSSAAHLTASMLSSVYPSEPYGNTNVMIPRYGANKDDADDWEQVSLGSLELIRAEATFRQLFPSQVQYTQISGRKVSDVDLDVTIDRSSYDLVIMNPPFTRAASDWDHEERAVKQYRGLGTSAAVQDLMARRQRELFRNTCFDGYAGLASAFPAIADAMLKDGGKLAFVLPFTSMCGARWHKFRNLLRDSYGSITVISIVQPRDSERSFSADTGMAECLVIATKGDDCRTCTFVSLHERPLNSMVAAEVARAIRGLSVADIDSALSGGTPCVLGDDEVGRAIRVRTNAMQTWAPAGVKDLLLAQISHALADGELRLPQLDAPVSLPMERVGEIAEIGTNAANIAGPANAAFLREPISSLGAYYPILWQRNASRDKSLLLEPDFEGTVNNESRVATVWSTRSWAHFSSSARLNTQALTACITERESLGGSGWPNVKFGDRLLEVAFVVWSNSTLGLLLNWYYGPRQQSGRTRHGVESYALVPTLNVRRLSPEQLNMFGRIFEEFKNVELLPMHLAYRDEARKKLDRAMFLDGLDLPEELLEPLDILRNRWCGEPTVYANRKDGIVHE